MVPGHHIVNLGGLDTKGMEGAVLLATSKSGVEDLARARSPVRQVNPNDQDTVIPGSAAREPGKRQPNYFVFIQVIS